MNLHEANAIRWKCDPPIAVLAGGPAREGRHSAAAIIRFCFMGVSGEHRRRRESGGSGRCSSGRAWSLRPGCSWTRRSGRCGARRAGCAEAPGDPDPGVSRPCSGGPRGTRCATPPSRRSPSPRAAPRGHLGGARIKSARGMPTPERNRDRAADRSPSTVETSGVQLGSRLHRIGTSPADVGRRTSSSHEDGRASCAHASSRKARTASSACQRFASRMKLCVAAPSSTQRL